MNKLAIGITTYNDQINIDNLELIYNLEYIDVFIVDDHSTDDTQKLLSERNIKFEVTPYKIGGPGYARNMILEKAIANGNQFITYVDGDDAVIEENLKAFATSLSSKYDMYYTPVFAVGYNDALVPLGTSNFEVTGHKTAAELATDENKRVRYSLLGGSGGRVYNLQVISDNNLQYNPNKPGQDVLFNHEFFQFVNDVYFFDVTKPYYIYDIQMGSLSNNYKVENVTNRLSLAKRSSSFSHSMRTVEEFARNTFIRNTASLLMPEQDKVEVAKALTEFANTQFDYVPTNDYLNVCDFNADFDRGINIVLINHILDIPSHPLINVVKIDSSADISSLHPQLIYNKTIFIDKSIVAVDIDFLIESIDITNPIIQPRYRSLDGVDIHELGKLIYHGFSQAGLTSTYTYIGMIFDSSCFFKYDFNFNSAYEYLMKAMYFNAAVPVMYNTTGFITVNNSYFAKIRSSVTRLFARSYFATSKAKVWPFDALVKAPIQKGNFIGIDCSYDSANLSYEDQSFIETELLEFKNFDGAYIIDENNQIIETTSQADELNFEQMILAKKVPLKQSTLSNKKLINLPKQYGVDGYLSVKFSRFSAIYKSNEDTIISDSYLQFNEERIIKGAYKDYIKLIAENGDIVTTESGVVPKGLYRLVFDQSNKWCINRLLDIEFTYAKSYQ